MPLPLLGEMVALLVVSVIIAYLCYRVRLVPIVGFLLAGVLIGPGALGLVQDVALINNLAEIGVILLLFTIGVEFSLEKLWTIKRFILLGGGLQTGAVVASVTLLLSLFGVAWQVGLFTGFLVVLSSTAIVLKLFQERAEVDTPVGQVSMALLIFQDLAMVMMVLLVPSLSGQGGTAWDLVVVVLKVVAILSIVLLLARRLVPWLLEKIAQTRREELFLLTIVMLCFGTAWLTSLFNVSLALGAFLAGLVVSESRYSGYALSEILPLRTVFNAIFFVSIGMLLNLGFVLDNLAMVLVVAATVLVLKAVVTAATVAVMGYPWRIAAMSGLALAQICESSFVLERAGAAVGLTPAGLGLMGQQTFIAVAVLLMVLTPFMMQAGPRVGAWFSDDASDDAPDGRLLAARGERLENHVIVVGYGPAGRALVRSMEETGIPYLIIEMNPRTIAELDAAGRPVLFGDAGRMQTLEHAGIRAAKLCVIVVNDGRAVRSIVEMAHFLNPTLQILARARFLNDVEKLQALGADVVVPEELETAVRVLSQALEAYLLPEDVIAREVALLRGETPALRQEEESGARRQLAGLDRQGLHTRTVTVRPGALAAGQTLADLALRRAFGLTVLAVRRDGETTGGPGGDFAVQAGDRLILVGTAEQYERSSHLFRSTPAQGRTPLGA